MENNKIDIVIIWVDGNDPEWQKEKNKYNPAKGADASIQRYRDWDLLKYWFRGIEKYAPWVNRIHFVTWGHIPKWLNTNNTKLNIVKHIDYIPAEYLPTFNARTIDLNLHRIEGLTENFVFFNDDFYLIDNVKPTDFFTTSGVPMDSIGLNVHCPTIGNTGQFACFNDVAVINKHFNMNKCIKRDWKKWYSLKNGKLLLRTMALRSCPRFPGFYQHHIAVSYKKSTFEKVWNAEFDILDKTCRNKFRENTDVNDWVFKEWQIAEGNFEVRSNKFGKSFFIDRDGMKSIKHDICNYIKKQKGKMIAINDGPMSNAEFDEITRLVRESFDSILPEPSSFEISED